MNMTFKQIDDELRSIVSKLESDEEYSEEDINKFEQRAKELEDLRKSLKEKAQQRAAILENVKNGVIGKTVESVEERKVDNKMNEEKDILRDAEYRSAFLKKLQGKKLNESEERAMTTATNSVGAVIPTVTQDLVMQKLEEAAPLLNEIELMRVNGNVTFAVEADATDANIHAEGAAITEDGDVLIPVNLNSYEITKYITISKTVAKMSVDAFENWLTNMLARRIARKITKLIINGTGSNQPTGVAQANNWSDKNSVTIAKAASLTTENVIKLTSLLPGAYDANAKWLMSKKTLLNDFRPLQNKGKDDIFAKIDGKYYVEGYEVMLDDSVADHEAYLGNFKMYAGNLGEDVTVDTDKKLSSNSFEYLGCANFDGKPAIGEAFVKLIKATA